jgi:hypothetical protein
MPSVQCPAGEDVHPILSPNDLDVECRIQGNLRPAVRSNGQLAICCDHYDRCPVWREHKETNWESRTVKIDEMQRARSKHTLTDAERERVVA